MQLNRTLWITIVSITINKGSGNYMQNKEKRYFLIDGIRGAAIINMVLF